MKQINATHALAFCYLKYSTPLVYVANELGSAAMQPESYRTQTHPQIDASWGWQGEAVGGVGSPTKPVNKPKYTAGSLVT